MPAATEELRIPVENAGEVSAVLVQPDRTHALLILAHGAGAGMRHPFLHLLSRELAEVGVATLRYQFPYMEQRRKVPDRLPVLAATVRAAVAAGAKAAGDLILLAGGKSMGGRMTSLAASKEPLEKVRGLVFFGFPLHPPNRPGTERGEYLKLVGVPMLFLQGTCDQFAQLDLLRPVCEGLGKRATLQLFEGADHSFHVPKSSGRTDAQVMRELAETTAAWTKQL